MYTSVSCIHPMSHFMPNPSPPRWGGRETMGQAVDVDDVEPVVGAGEEEALDLRAAVVEDLRVPVGVVPLPRIGVLEEVGPVEVGEAAAVLGGGGRGPGGGNTE